MQGRNRLRNRIKAIEVIRFVSMTSLGSIAAPDCHTGKKTDILNARASFPVIVVVL